MYMMRFMNIEMKLTMCLLHMSRARLMRQTGMRGQLEK